MISALAIAVHAVIGGTGRGISVKDKAFLFIAVIGNDKFFIMGDGIILCFAYPFPAVGHDLVLLRNPLRGQLHAAVSDGRRDRLFIIIQLSVIDIVLIQPLIILGAVAITENLVIRGTLRTPSGKQVAVLGKGTFAQLGALAVFDIGALHLALTRAGIVADMISDTARSVEADPVQRIAAVIQRGIEGVADVEDVLYLIGVIHRDIGDMVALIVIDDQQIVTAALDKIDVVVITIAALTGIAGLDAFKLLDDLKIRVEQGKVIRAGQTDDIALTLRVISDGIDILVDLDVLDRREGIGIDQRDHIVVRGVVRDNQIILVRIIGHVIGVTHIDDLFLFDVLP